MCVQANITGRDGMDEAIKRAQRTKEIISSLNPCWNLEEAGKLSKKPWISGIRIRREKRQLKYQKTCSDTTRTLPSLLQRLILL